VQALQAWPLGLDQVTFWTSAHTCPLGDRCPGDRCPAAGRRVCLLCPAPLPPGRPRAGRKHAYCPLLESRSLLALPHHARGGPLSNSWLLADHQSKHSCAAAGVSADNQNISFLPAILSTCTRESSEAHCPPLSPAHSRSTRSCSNNPPKTGGAWKKRRGFSYSMILKKRRGFSYSMILLILCGCAEERHTDSGAGGLLDVDLRNWGVGRPTPERRRAGYVERGVCPCACPVTRRRWRGGQSPCGVCVRA
jgi:hypothetical protein